MSTPKDRPPAPVVDLFPQEPPPALIGVVREMVRLGNKDMRLVGVVRYMEPAEPGPLPPDDEPPGAA